MMYKLLDNQCEFQVWWLQSFQCPGMLIKIDLFFVDQRHPNEILIVLTEDVMVKSYHQR